MTVHNLTRPGQPPGPGDIVEVEEDRGYIMAVDPATWLATTERQRFRVADDGTREPIRSTSHDDAAQ